METPGPAISLDIENPLLGDEVELVQVSSVSAQWRVDKSLSKYR